MVLSDIEILNNTFIYINRYVLPILYVFGNIGNLLSALVFFKRTWKKNVCVFYFNICLLAESCYINSGMLSAFFTYGLNIHAEISNIIICKLLYYVSYLFSALLPNVLIFASIDRLLISSQNIDTRLYSSKRLAYFSLSISILMWILFYCHLLVRVYIYEIYPMVIVCYYQTTGFYFEFNLYSNAIIDVLFSVLLIILSIMAFKKVRRIRIVPRQQRNQIRTMNKKDFQLLRCLYVHDIVFIIFVSFPSIYGIYIAVTKDTIYSSLDQAIINFISNFSTFIHHIPFCVSFLIFINISKAFRQEIKRMGYKICDKNLMPTQEEENKQQNYSKEMAEINVASIIELPA